MEKEVNDLQKLTQQIKIYSNHDIMTICTRDKLGCTLHICKITIIYFNCLAAKLG